METNKLTKEQIEKEIQLAIDDGVVIDANSLCDLPRVEELKSIADTTGVKFTIDRIVNKNDNHYSYLVAFYGPKFETLCRYWTMDFYPGEENMGNFKGGTIFSYRPEKLASAKSPIPHGITKFEESLKEEEDDQSN